MTSSIIAAAFAAFEKNFTAEDAATLGESVATALKRITHLMNGGFTPADGLWSCQALAAFQNREPETVRKWCEKNGVPVFKAGRENCYRASDVIKAARREAADDGQAFDDEPLQTLVERLHMLATAIVVPDGLRVDIRGVAAMFGLTEDGARSLLDRIGIEFTKPGRTRLYRTDDIAKAVTE